MNRIARAIETLKKGPSHLSQLETLLNDMTMPERKLLADTVEAQDIPAPRIVFYDYTQQIWVQDWKAPVTPQVK
jgi:hypothetical protein